MYATNEMVRNKHQSIRELLSQEEQMAPNCFTLSVKGLRDGIELTLRGHDTNEPHLFVGGRRIFLHRTHASLYRYTAADTGIVRRADIELVGPENNPFRVLRRVYGDLESTLVVIHHGTDKLTQLKKEVIDLNIWHGVTGTAELVCNGPEDALVRFHTEGQTVSALFPDGRVSTLILMDGRVQKLRLTTEEMAKVRVEHAKKQLVIASDADDVRQWDGVVWGMIKLLSLTKADLATRDILVEFLKRNDITDLMRQEIRGRLRELGDPRSESGWFTDREYDREARVEQKQVPAVDKLAKKNARRAEDAALRLRMKGSSGGGGGKKGQKKEGKKGKR